MQDNEILNIYESNSVTQLIYGRQFSYLYRAICELLDENNVTRKISNYNTVFNILKYVVSGNSFKSYRDSHLAISVQNPSFKTNV